MSAAPSLATAPAPPGRIAAPALGPLPLALVVTGILTALRLLDRVDSDVAWQLWIAGRIHAGANLYSDIIETNPPLWFWMAVPLERLATFLSLRIEAVDVLAMGAFAALSLAATSRLIEHIEPSRRALFLIYAALALLAIPWVHVGQREQIVLIGTLPYAALIALRREGSGVSSTLAFSIGVGSAIGFALKHYFLIVPVVLELWLAAGQRAQWRPRRPECVAVVLVGLSYATAVVWLEPDFLTRIVPLVRLAYGALGAPSLRYMFGPFAIVGLLILGFVALFACSVRRSRAPLSRALLAAAFAFAAAYFVQFKGWPYHAIPLIGCSSLALAAMLAELELVPPFARMLAPALLLLPLVHSAEEQVHPSLPDKDLLSATAGLQPGDSVGFLTTETAIPWSVTLQGRYRYASRYNGFWMMRAIRLNELSGHPDPALVRLGGQVVAETVTDFLCIPPKRIIVKRARPGESVLDILPLFLRDPSFVALMAHYRARSRTTVETYELVSPLPQPSGPCRQGV